MSDLMIRCPMFEMLKKCVVHFSGIYALFQIATVYSFICIECFELLVFSYLRVKLDFFSVLFRLDIIECRFATQETKLSKQIWFKILSLSDWAATKTEDTIQIWTYASMCVCVSVYKAVSMCVYADPDRRINKNKTMKYRKHMKKM